MKILFTVFLFSALALGVAATGLLFDLPDEIFDIIIRFGDLKTYLKFSLTCSLLFSRFDVNLALGLPLPFHPSCGQMNSRLFWINRILGIGSRVGGLVADPLLEHLLVSHLQEKWSEELPVVQAVGKLILKKNFVTAYSENYENTLLFCKLLEIPKDYIILNLVKARKPIPNHLVSSIRVSNVLLRMNAYADFTEDDILYLLTQTPRTYFLAIKELLQLAVKLPQEKVQYDRFNDAILKMLSKIPFWPTEISMDLLRRDPKAVQAHQEFMNKNVH